MLLRLIWKVVCRVFDLHELAVLLMQSLPFLKAIKPGALAALLTNGLSIDMTAVVDFAKTTLLPTM
jgi:hypothetical protein